MHLFFDTETTGMPNRHAPLESPLQPRLVQIGAILTDESYVPRAQLALLIHPEGTTFDPGAVKVHGITEDIAARFGVPLKTGLELFSELVLRADVLIAHNFEFDAKIFAIQYARLGMADPIPKKRCDDTMLLSQKICAIPARRGEGFKPPSLVEAYRHFFQAEFRSKADDPHDALEDARACMRVYVAMRPAPSPPTPDEPKEPVQLDLFGG